MRKAAHVAGALLILLPACTSQQTGVGPTLGSPVSPASSAFAAITVGQELRDTFIGNPRTYDLTAPADGTLVLKLSWDPRVNGARLMLALGDMSFRASAPDWSPVVGRVTVSAGQTYRVKIDEGVAPWDYGFNDPFVLTTSIEPGGAFDY